MTHENFYRYALSMQQMDKDNMPIVIKGNDDLINDSHWFDALRYNLGVAQAGAWAPVSSLSQMSGRASQLIQQEHMQNVALNQAQQMQQTAGIFGYLKDGNESK